VGFIQVYTGDDCLLMGVEGYVTPNTGGLEDLKKNSYISGVGAKRFLVRGS
jgi:hypothetical protein